MEAHINIDMYKECRIYWETIVQNATEIRDEKGPTTNFLAMFDLIKFKFEDSLLSVCLVVDNKNAINEFVK